MTVTVHHLPTSVPVPDDMSDAELRAWWFGFVAGSQDRNTYWKGQIAHIIDAVDKSRAGRDDRIGERPVLKAVR